MIRVGLSRRTLINRMVRQDFAYISDLAPAAWYRFGQGITVTGAGVSTWADQSGNGNDLLQGTDTNRPALQADGSILFDGADNFLAATFTLNQPATIYALVKSVTWTNNEGIFDGVTGRIALLQTGVSPAVRLFAGSAGPQDNTISLGVYAAYGCVFNGASSVLQVNSATTAASDVGAGNGGGLTVGSGNGGTFGWSNIEAKELIVYAAAHNATQRGMVIRYLARVGGLSI